MGEKEISAIRNIRLTIEYDGTNYLGWQRQRGGPTIQETIEKAIEKITKNGAKLIGSGRTDTGVHALGQVANFRTPSAIQTNQLQEALNAILPQDISISGCEEVDIGFHAQHNARSKIYGYLILHRPYPSALNRRRAWHIRFPLNLAEMRDASKSLTGEHDFRAFGLSTHALKSTVREVFRAEILTERNDSIWFEIEATGFLKRMIRLIVGALIQVGRERITVEGFRRILESGERTKFVRAAPPWGLYLKEVKY